MISAHLLLTDLNSLCELIDKNSMDDEDESSVNFTINESLSYIRQSFLPYLMEHNQMIFEEA